MSTTAMSEVIEILRNEAAQLRDFCAALAPEAWATPSACAGWAVGDVCAHLTQGAYTWSASIRRALQGDANPPSGEQALRPGERGSEATAQRAIAFRQEREATGLLDAFTEGHTQFHQTLLAVPPADWDRPCYHRRGNMSIRHYTVLRLQELLIHGWDMRSAVDTTATLPPAPLPLLAPCVERWLRHAFHPAPGPTGLVRYHFETTAPSPLPHHIVVRPEGLRLEPVSTAPADVTFRCTPGDALLVIYGRLSLPQALEKSRVEMHGNHAQGLLFPTLFHGF